MDRQKKRVSASVLFLILFMTLCSTAHAQYISPDLYATADYPAGDNRNYNLFDIGPGQDIYMKIYGYDFTDIVLFYATIAFDTSRIRWQPIGDSLGFLYETDVESNILHNNSSVTIKANVGELGKNKCDEDLSAFTIECLLWSIPYTQEIAADGNGLMAVLHFKTAAGFTAADTAAITIMEYRLQNWESSAEGYYSKRRIYATINHYSPLSVEISAFTAGRNETGSTVDVEWEINETSTVAGYYLERRYESGEYVQIAYIPGQNTPGGNRYACEDTDANRAGIYYYRLKILHIDGTTAYTDPVSVTVTTPAEFVLHQNYPNPFNGETRIRFSLTQESPVTLKIYDTTGRLAKTIIAEKMQPGDYAVPVSAESLASGTYFYRLTAGQHDIVKKMTIVK